MSLPSNTNASLSTSFYAPRDAGGALVGVTSLNGLIGITAITGDTSVGVSTPGLGAVQLTTAGKPQVPSSVTATGAVIGATVTATGVLAGASANIAGVLAAGSITSGNMLSSSQSSQYVPVNGGNGSALCNFMQIGSLGVMFGFGTTGGNGFLELALPVGRTGTPLSISATTLGTNLPGEAGVYGVYNAVNGQIIYVQAADRTNGNSVAAIQMSFLAIFSMTN